MLAPVKFEPLIVTLRFKVLVLAPLGLIDVFAATLPSLAFSPGVHINYAEKVLPMRDGLPKLKDFPAEFGGSGEQIAE